MQLPPSLGIVTKHAYSPSALLFWSACNSNLIFVMKSLNQLIAILEVEAAMIESHVGKLATMATVTGDEEHRLELLRLADEEATEAQQIRHQVCLLRDHLDEGSPI
jgi:hypothetical protein